MRMETLEITAPKEVARRYTSAEFRLLPQGPPYFELINGTLVRSPSPKFPHQHASNELVFLLNLYVRERGIGIVLSAPMDVEFDQFNTFQPDILFISSERSHLITGDGDIVGAPDLVVEILSKNRVKDLGTKRYFYEIHNVREYWIVDLQKKTIEVLENQDMEFVRHSYAKRTGEVESKLLPGFRVNVEEIFE